MISYAVVLSTIIPCFYIDEAIFGATEDTKAEPIDDLSAGTREETRDFPTLRRGLAKLDKTESINYVLIYYI